MKYSIIPAAGLATRFLPASKTTPKEMFPILNKPSIQYVVEEAVSANYNSVIFVSSTDKESILDHFDTINSKFPLKNLSQNTRNDIETLDSLIEVLSIRQKKPLGLGHAVLKGATLTGNDSFSVLLPDMLLFPKKNKSTMKEMTKLHEKTGFSIVALMKVPDNEKNKYGIVEGKKIKKNILEISKLLEKPSLKDTKSNLAIVGRYIFTPTIKTCLQNTKQGKKGEIDLTDAMTELLNTEKIYGLIIDDDSIVFDTGNSEGFALANTYLALKTLPNFRDKLNSLLEKFN